MILYRVGRFFYKSRLPLFRMCDLLIRLVHNSAVFSETSIGEGTKFAYGGIGVVIHKKAVIGANCVIGSNVTIGGRSKMEGLPVIGDRVYIATGAKLLGPIVIGDDSVIGANAVVISDVPSGSVVVGVPARIIKRDIKSLDYY